MSKPDKPVPRPGKPHTEHWGDYFSEHFGKESDRAAVILAAAMLEHALEVLLKSRLVPSPTQGDSLFEGAYAPLASFSAKIDVAFRIGLIAPAFARDLHLIRKIRNDFAHNVTGCTFDDAVVRGRVVELVRSQGIVDDNKEVRNKMVPGPRGDFEMTISWMLWSLWSDTDDVKPIRAVPDYYPEDHEEASPDDKKP
jgi:hypothetical protein